MSAPLYYLPRVTIQNLAQNGRLSRSLLESRGLGEAWSDVERLDDVAYCQVHAKAPDAGAGLVVCALPISREMPPRVGCFCADPGQRWTRISDGLWLAIEAAAPPGPADLARPTRHAGHWVRLGDGEEWEVPVIRDPLGGGTSLPRDMFWEEGQFRLELRSQYQALWDATERVAELFFSPNSRGFGRIDLQDALRIAVAALGLNYRFGQPEQRALRLVTSANWEAVLGAMVDLPRVQQALGELESAEKKSAPSSTAPGSIVLASGGEADSPVIAPAAASIGSPGGCEEGLGIRD